MSCQGIEILVAGQYGFVSALLIITACSLWFFRVFPVVFSFDLRFPLSCTFVILLL